MAAVAAYGVVVIGVWLYAERSGGFALEEKKKEIIVVRKEKRI